jgi:hypothetical protein
MSDTDSDGIITVNAGSERIPVLIPRTFNGTTPVRDYIIHFKGVAKGNNWSEETKLFQLRHSLSGDAEYAINSNDQTFTYRTLVNELEALYGPRSDEAVRIAVELRQRKLKSGETLQNLAHDIRRRVKIAYAHKSVNDQELDCVEIFCHAMVNTEIVEELIKLAPRNLRQALEIAQRIETIQNAALEITGRAQSRRARVVAEEDPGIESLRREIRQLNLSASEKRGAPTKSPREMFCMNCEQEGHLFPDCDQPTKCWYCKSTEHSKFECPKRELCDRCGMRGHKSHQCRVCARCGLGGHRTKDCRAKPKAPRLN